MLLRYIKFKKIIKNIIIFLTKIVKQYISTQKENFLTFHKYFLDSFIFSNVLFPLFSFVPSIFDYLFLNFVKYIFGILCKSNILYIKLVQWIFNDTKYLSNSINEYLNSFKDSAPYSEEDIDWEEIFKLKDLVGEENFFIDKTPINSGTIAIVFNGKINNENVIFKVKRRNIEQNFSKLKSSLLFMSKIVNLIYSYNFKNIFVKLSKTLETQCNFINEAKNINLFYKKSCKFSRIDPIKCFENLSSNNLIVMTKSMGIIPTLLNKKDFEKFQIYYLECSLFMFFSKGISHGDAHYGNILYNPKTSKITYIDFGIMLYLNVLDTTSYQDLAFCCLETPELFPDIVMEKIDLVCIDKNDQKKVIELCKNSSIVKTECFNDSMLEISKFLSHILSIDVIFKEELSLSIILIISMTRVMLNIKDDSIIKKIFAKLK